MQRHESDSEALSCHFQAELRSADTANITSKAAPSLHFNNSDIENMKFKRGRANACLTSEEKQEKRRLKRSLKRQTKIHRLNTKIKHAINRKDFIVEKQTRKELESYLQEVTQEGTTGDMKLSKNEENANSKQWILQFVGELISMGDQTVRHDKSHVHNTKSIKEYQTSKAVSLLKHMTKGTQQITMFDDTETLW